MKLLVLTSSYPTKDNQSSGPFIQTLTRELSRKGIAVTVLIFSNNRKLHKYEDKDGVTVIQYPYSLFFSPSLHKYQGLIPSLKNSLLAKIEFPFYLISTGLNLFKYAKDCDLIHAHWFFPSGFIAAILKGFIKKPLVVTAWGAEFHLNNNILSRKLLNFVYLRANKCTTVSKYMKKISQKYFPNDILVIPNGINCQKFRPSTNKKKSSIVTIGTVRRLVPEKRIQDLLEAISNLDEQLKKKVRIIIVGDGPEREKLETISMEYRISDKVKFLGNISHGHIPEIINKMDIVVNPSVQEGMATVNLEAMACGKPVIATNFFGNDEMIVYGKTGFLYQPKNPRDLSKKLNTLIGDEELRINMGIQARKTVKKRFAMELIAKEYQRVYKQVIGKSGRHKTYG